MNQDRRKDENRPADPLVFTDEKLIAAGLAHLTAEKAAACLVRAKDDVWVGVGSKDALRGLLREFASQSQAFPSELASLQRYCIGPISMIGIDTGAWVKFADVQSLFSHSAATGKVPEDGAHVECRECVDCGHAGINDADSEKSACHRCDWSGPSPEQDECPGCGIGNCMGAACPKCGALYKLMAEADVVASPAAPLAAAVPAEEAKPCLMGEYACSNPAQCWEPCGQLGKSAEHATPADAEQATDELSDEEKAALDRLDKPEWRAASHLKLRAMLAVEVARTIRMGAKIENLQDELRVTEGYRRGYADGTADAARIADVQGEWRSIWDEAPAQGDGVLATDGATVISARWLSTGWATHSFDNDEVVYLPEGRVTHWKPFAASPAAPLAGKAEPSKQDDGWPDEIYLQAGDEPLGNFSEYDEVSWCDHPEGESDVRYVRADAPLAAAVPAEEATIVVQPGNAFIAPPGYKVEHVPAEPAPTQSSGLKHAQIIRIARQYFAEEWAQEHAEHAIYDALKELARLSKPTAPVAQQSEAFCQKCQRNVPPNEVNEAGYHCLLLNGCGQRIGNQPVEAGAPTAAAECVIPEGFEAAHLPRDDSMTDEWNARNRFTVRRIVPPFCDKDGIRQWAGSTLPEAIEKACSLLGLVTTSGRESATPAPTDLSKRLREAATAEVSYADARLLIGAADEIERYYGGMMAWKKTAEKKDADWNAERTARVNDRCAARAEAGRESAAPLDRDIHAASRGDSAGAPLGGGGGTFHFGPCAKAGHAGCGCGAGYCARDAAMQKGAQDNA